MRLRRRTFDVLPFLVRNSGRLLLGETAGTPGRVASRYSRQRVFEPLLGLGVRRLVGLAGLLPHAETRAAASSNG